jgi:hypothetical protein
LRIENRGSKIAIVYPQSSIFNFSTGPDKLKDAEEGEKPFTEVKQRKQLAAELDILDHLLLHVGWLLKDGRNPLVNFVR